MTHQIPDRLIIDHPWIDFHGMGLYGLIQGAIQTNCGWGEEFNFSVRPTPPLNCAQSTCLYRGYIATFCLQRDGLLRLLEYRFPQAIMDAEEPSYRYIVQPVDVILEGDFWLVLKHGMEHPRTYVPFKNGRIDERRSNWLREFPQVMGTVRDLRRDGSLSVRAFSEYGFIPRESIPDEFAHFAESLVGRTISCEVLQRDLKSNDLIFKFISIFDDEDDADRWFRRYYYLPLLSDVIDLEAVPE